MVVTEHLGKRLQRRIVIDVGKTPHGLVDAVAVDVTAESLSGLLVDRTGDIGAVGVEPLGEPFDGQVVLAVDAFGLHQVLDPGEEFGVAHGVVVTVGRRLFGLRGGRAGGGMAGSAAFFSFFRNSYCCRTICLYILSLRR